MKHRSQLVVVALALCTLVALSVWFAHESDVESAVRSDASATEASRASPELALESLAAAANSGSARLEAAPAPSAAPRLPTTMVIGRVVGLDGTPIVGARVRRGTEDELGRARLDPTTLFELGARELATPTDVEGRFVFSGVPADGEALVVGPEHVDFIAEQPWSIAKPGAECVFVMEPLALGELRVEVVHARTGEGLAYFDAVATLLDRTGTPRRRTWTLPGRQGVAGADVRFIAGASIEVALLMRPMAIGRAPTTVRVIQPIEGDVVVVRFAIDPEREPVADGAAIVTGIVVEQESGAPIRGARVVSTVETESGVADDGQRERPQYAVSTDSEGRFRLRLSASDSLLNVSAPTRLPATRSVHDGEDVRIELARGLYVELRVVTRDGKPALPRFASFVRLEPEPNAPDQQIVVQTNGEGLWTAADMAPGRWEIRVSRATRNDTPIEEILAERETASGTVFELIADSIVRTVELTADTPPEIVFEVDD